MPHASAGRHALSAVIVALLVAGAGCAGNQKASAPETLKPPAPQAIETTLVSSQQTETEKETSFFARLNPFRKKEKPSEEETSKAKELAKEGDSNKSKEERGFFGRWFGRSKGLPTATEETVQGRSAETAKGEISPPAFEYNGLGLDLGRTSKARIIASFGEPENTFFSEGAEEILIYRRIRHVDSLYIFLDSQGLVKDYIVTKRQ